MEKRLVCLSVAAVLSIFNGIVSAATYPSATYLGNGRDDHGGEVGLGSLTLDPTDAQFRGTFYRGNNSSFDGFLVLYIDSKVGGITTTAGLADYGNGFQNAVSAYNGTSRTTLNFATDFAADYALVLSPRGGGGRLFSLGGNGVEQVSLPEFMSPASGETAAAYSFAFAWDYLGSSATGTTNTLKFQSSYSLPSGLRSLEAFETMTGSANWGGTLTYGQFNTFPAVPEPTTVALGVFVVMGCAASGWKRWRRSRASGARSSSIR